MNIIFDLDSTLSTIEGIDELGALKNKRVEIEALTNLAMCGEIPLDEVFLKRLEILQPSQDDMNSIASLYLANITPFALEVISMLQQRHRVFVVTGGYDCCTLPLTKHLGISQVYANSLQFDEAGNYIGLDTSIPLWRNGGKGKVVSEIKNTYPDFSVMIGDGQSDLEAGADAFIYFAGVVDRKPVRSKAQFVIHDLRELLTHELLK